LVMMAPDGGFTYLRKTASRAWCPHLYGFGCVLECSSYR
jgi:hypothetical protein